MRKFLIGALASVFLLPTVAFASLNGTPDFSEPRVVAVYASNSNSFSPWANASGYLYSPRIVFTAGHLKDNNEVSTFFVADPNQKLKSGMKAVKVEKVFYPENYTKGIYSNDFAIFVLSAPLAQVKNAQLATPELIKQAVASQIPMKVIGYGVYQDACKAMKKEPPCRSGNDITSSVPRSIYMNPFDAFGIKEKYNSFDPRIEDHLFLTTTEKGGPCPGDSGGPTTVALNGIQYYVGTVPSGFWNAYACGQSEYRPGDIIGWTAPVYKFSDLIAQAEKYVLDHPVKTASKTTPAKKKK